MAHETEGFPAIFGAPIPDVFADEAVTFDMVNNTLRITFAVYTATEPAAPSPVAFASIGRLIMPVESAQRLSLALYDYLKKVGRDPTELGAAGQTKQ